MSEPVAIVNGKLSPLGEASVGVMDLGFLRGLAVFETVRTYSGGCPYALDEHLNRLWDGALQIGVEPFFTSDEVRKELRLGYEAAGYPEMSANMVVTPGALVGGHFDGDRPTRVIIVRPLNSYASLRAKGVSVQTFEAERMLPGVKTTNYVLGRIGLKKAQEKGAHEGLYRDSFGVVREGVTSNVMMLSKGTVYTPGRDCLDGVTLRAIRRVAGAEGLGWVASTLRLEAMKDADEIWISSSIREMLPVTSLDGHMIGAGVPGPMFEQIYRALRLGFEQESYGDNQAYLPRLA